MLFFTQSFCSRNVFVYCDDIFPELEENKMPVNADFYVQVTNMEIPMENEFDSTAIWTQLKPDLDFPETNLQEGRNQGNCVNIEA